MFFLLLFVLGLTNGEEDVKDCQPKLADYCFRNFSLSTLLCYDNKNCQFNPDTVCNVLQERINCAQEIIDTDCQTERRNNFDRWITATMAVHTFICKFNENKQSMMALITEEENGKRCWDTNTFLQCVEQKTRITHIVDMLQVMIDINECNWILIAFTTCNMKAETCRGRKDVLSEVFHIFIEKIGCTAYCSRSSKNFNYHINKFIFILLLIQYIFFFK